MTDPPHDHDCRFTGPDVEGFFWLQRTETSGAFGIINLGCCDEDDILTAMVKVLGEKGWIEPPVPDGSDPNTDAASDRGKRASFDRESGEVSGSGAGIGNPASSEDYDDDISVGSGSDRQTGGPSNSA